MWRKYSIGSSPLTSFSSMTLARQLFSIAPLAVPHILASPLLFTLLPCLAHKKCFRTWAMITYPFYKLPLFLRSSAPTNVHHPSIFRKLVGMTLLFTSTLISLYRKILPFFSFLCCGFLCIFGFKCGQIFHSFFDASNADLKPGGLLK